MRYKEFLLQVAKYWAADKVDTDSDTGTDAARKGTGASSQTPRVPHEDPPRRLPCDMRKHVLEKTDGSERGKRKYPARRCHVCAAHKKKKRNSVHLQVLLSATPQRGMFPEVSHPPALLGSLVSIS